MGHLSIVNNETMKEVICKGCISTYGKIKSERNMVKTAADLFADALAVRTGDLIFPWVVKSKVSENLGFRYVFQVAGPPRFVLGDEHPIKIPLKTEGTKYIKKLSEADALDLWESKLLWNAIGKKSLGRGRSFTHQTKLEDERMLELLGDESSPITIGPFQNCGDALTINPSQTEWKNDLDNALRELIEEEKHDEVLRSIKISDVKFVDGKFFIVEKVLEAWLTENIDKESCSQLLSLLNIEKIKWFGNYLPFGIQGGNIDIVIIHERSGLLVGTVIELKHKNLSKNDYEKAAAQAINYSRFIKKAFGAYDSHLIMEPIVLSGKSNPRKTPVLVNGGGLPVHWITYEIDGNGNVTFKRML